jgi:uncharacterized membrane protein
MLPPIRGSPQQRSASMTQPPMPPAPPPPPATAGPDQGNRTLMIFLAYLWILAVIPLLVEKDDGEVQWHAKHGLVLTVLEIVLYVVLGVLSFVPVLGCVVVFVPFMVAVGFLVIRVMAIVKAMNGQRFILPGISDFANRF